MAQPHSGGRGGSPTHYEILAITPKHLEGQSAPSQAKVVKKAYHRALLRNHPDKANAASRHNNSSSASTTTTPTPTTTTYTVDQIQEAYSVLSDGKRRTEYNRTLFQQSHSRSHHHHPPSHASSGGGRDSGTTNSNTTSWSFRTGVETADLDDLGFDERRGLYFRSCRCGNPRGYRFGDADLEECEGEGILMVECLDCSLWLRVLFAPAGAASGDEDDKGGPEEEEEEEEEQAAVAKQQQQQSNNNNHEVVASGKRQGSGETSRGFRFNWSFSWGISVGGSASASASNNTSRTTGSGS